MAKRSPRKRQVAKTDKAFREYILARDGYQCVQCGERERTKLSCGHLFSCVAYSTRWDENNAACQCCSCNMRHEYDFWPFYRVFEGKMSPDELSALHRKWSTPEKFTTARLELMEQGYKERAKTLQEDQ